MAQNLVEGYIALALNIFVGDQLDGVAVELYESRKLAGLSTMSSFFKGREG